MPSVASRVGDADLIELEEPTQYLCPGCGSPNVAKLDKINVRYNTCYRCNECSHVFSPLEFNDDLESQASR